MSIDLKTPDITELKPRIVVFGVGGAGGNAVNNMIRSGLQGVEFVCANTDAQALTASESQRVVQMGIAVTEGLGAGSHPEIGEAAAEEVIDELKDHLTDAHMVFVTAGMGGGTGTGAAPVIARVAREMGILTVGVVTKPFMFEGARRMRTADAGIEQLQEHVDTLIVIPNQNLFRIANEKTTFADAFAMADEVLYSGVACITDLMVKEGLINLDFADVRAVMRSMGRAMMGTGEAGGEERAMKAAEAAIANPLLDETSMRGAGGLLISITGGNDLTLYEVDAAATRIREEVDTDANIILGATFDEALDGVVRVSVVATGIPVAGSVKSVPVPATNGAKPILRNEISASEAPSAPRTETVATSVPQIRASSPVSQQASISAEAPAASLDELSAQLRAAVGIAEAAPMPSLNQTQAAPAQAAAQPQSVISSDDVQMTRLSPQERSENMPAAPAPKPEPQLTVQHEEHEPEAFVPPVAETPGKVDFPPIPKIDDFPAHVQAEYEEHHRKLSGGEQSAQRKPGLFERLATGLSRRDEEAQAEYDARVEPEAADPLAEFAKKPKPARHESTVTQGERRGANLTVQPGDDDQYEIPAFLRRQNG